MVCFRSPADEPRGLHPWSLTSERYAQYLKDAFDLWYQQIKKGARQFHQYFDNLLLILDGQPPQVCAMGGQCSLQYVVEADGSVYPCDFYMLDHYKLGNFLTDTSRRNAGNAVGFRSVGAGAVGTGIFFRMV